MRMPLPRNSRRMAPMRRSNAQRHRRCRRSRTMSLPRNSRRSSFFSDDGTAKTKDGTKWIKCERKTFEFTKGVNKGAILVRYYSWYEAEPSVATMKMAHSRMMKDPKQRAADRNRRYAYSSNRLFPSCILTHPLHLIDHPSCHPFSSLISSSTLPTSLSGRKSTRTRPLKKELGRGSGRDREKNSKVRGNSGGSGNG